jgi:hypothetical protein
MRNECKICLGEHDDDIHAATLSVHAWFHTEVTKWLEEEPVLPIFDVDGNVLTTNAAA